MTLAFDADEQELAHTRRRLSRTSHRYRQTRDPLRHPNSALGRSLAHALSEAAASGVLSDLTWRVWASH